MDEFFTLRHPLIHRRDGLMPTRRISFPVLPILGKKPPPLSGVAAFSLSARDGGAGMVLGEVVPKVVPKVRRIVLRTLSPCLRFSRVFVASASFRSPDRQTGTLNETRAQRSCAP